MFQADAPLLPFDVLLDAESRRCCSCGSSESSLLEAAMPTAAAANAAASTAIPASAFLTGFPLPRLFVDGASLTVAQPPCNGSGVIGTRQPHVHERGRDKGGGVFSQL